MLNESELTTLMSRPDLPRIAENINAVLRNEQLARENFRHDLTPSMKAEFIAGEVVMHSPAKAKHLRVTVCLTRNDYEPDVCFFNTEKAVAFDGETMQFPAPDFIVEVLSAPTTFRDRGVKWDDYGLHGINEYWIIDCDEQTIEQYLIRSGETKYHLARKLTDGEIESVVVTGFRIPVIAIFNAKQNHLTLQKILKSFES